MKLFRFYKNDWNGFWALFADNLANMVILSGILIGVFDFDKEIVFGHILPGLGVTLLFGLAAYAFLGVRLARQEGRDDVTALPYGISTPVLFVFLFSIIGPVYFTSHDPLMAYRAGLAAAFVGGILEMCGSMIGPVLKRITPRAGMLGTLAGIAIVWIAAVPAAIIFEDPMIGLPALFIILLGLIGRFRLPLGVPAGLAAIAVGVAISFLMGESEITFADAAIHLPVPVFVDLWYGLRMLLERPEILAIVVPISIYNFIETMNNVESAQAAGDHYDVKTCQLIDGAGTCLGALFGSPFPTTVYIGHPAYKRLGARTGYSFAVGLVFFIAGIIGVIAFLRGVIPEAAVAPLLVFVGIVIAQQAFSATPKGHGVAVAFALIPHIADLLNKQIRGVINETLGADSITTGLMQNLINNQGVHLAGYSVLSQGAIITGLMWGAIVAFIVDHKLRHAIFFSLVLFALSATGVVHAEQLGINLSAVTLGYLILTILLAAFHYLELQRSGRSDKA